MSDALSGLPKPDDPNLLVGIETADDAAVYRLTDQLALINTLDFITPPVDDPWWFGQIAAANAISDVYAMGGRPLTALNIVMFPIKDLDPGMLKEILRGGHDKVAEAGAVLAGGHSVEDPEPKYGLSVSGLVHPDRILTNAGARPGDALVLTKPLGTGVLFNAVRAGKFPYGELEREILPTVAALNDKALLTALRFEVHACTDVTGFGIAGHALELARGSDTRISLKYHALPVYPGALEMYRNAVTTGSNAGNRSVCNPYLTMRVRLTKTDMEILFDPQTSGGLLFALPADRADELVKALHVAGIAAAARVGEVGKGPAVLEIN